MTELAVWVCVFFSRRFNHFLSSVFKTYSKQQKIMTNRDKRPNTMSGGSETKKNNPHNAAVCFCHPFRSYFSLWLDYCWWLFSHIWGPLPFYTTKISLGDGILRKCVFVIGLPWDCALKIHLICQTASYGGQGHAVPTLNTSLDANVPPVRKQQVRGWKYMTKVAVNSGDRDKKIDIEKGDEDNILQLPLKVVLWQRV